MTDHLETGATTSLPLPDDLIEHLSPASQWLLYINGARDVLKKAVEEGLLAAEELPLPIALERVQEKVSQNTESCERELTLAKIGNLMILEDCPAIYMKHGHHGIDVGFGTDGEPLFSSFNWSFGPLTATEAVPFY